MTGATREEFRTALDQVIAAFLADPARYRLHRMDVSVATNATGWSMADAYRVLDADVRLARQGAGWVRAGRMRSP